MKRIILEQTVTRLERKSLAPLKHMSMNFPYPIYEELIKTSNRTGYSLTDITILALKNYLKLK